MNLIPKGFYKSNPLIKGFIFCQIFPACASPPKNNKYISNTFDILQLHFTSHLI